MLIGELILFIGLIAWIIKDHRAVMVELERMREAGLQAENDSQNGIINVGNIAQSRSN